jgi:acyl-coenzyme A thioesterase PaaI-like protein
VDAVAIEASLEQIPYTLEMGIVIERASSGEVEMTLPDATANQNMVGIVHAGALYTFGETVAGIAAGIDLLDKAFPLARKAEIRYRRPASGAIRGRARVAAVDSERVMAELARDGRSELVVTVMLSDADGKTVAEMDVDYAFRAFSTSRAFKPREKS